MAVIKTYSSTCNFRTSCGEKEILFTPFYIQNEVVHRGTYTTSNPDEQRVIENDYFFGNRVFLDSVQTIDEPVDEIEQSVKEEVNAPAEKQPAEEEDNKQAEEQPAEETEQTAEKQPAEEKLAIEKTIVDEVTNFDEAATYMKEHFNLAESKVSTPAKLHNRMKEYNVEFPNLVIEK